MSEVAPARTLQQKQQVNPARSGRNRLNSLEALERGFALFRSTFGSEAWRYYLGAAPLVVALIPLWVINGQIRVSTASLLLEAALLTMAYLLRARMIGSYMERVRERAFGTPIARSTGIVARAAGLGRLLAWKIALTIGALAALPTVAGLSWLYTASQFASLEAREDGSERHTLSGCLALSSQWFGSGLLLLMMLLPLWIAVWLNGMIMAILVPQLLHSIFGLDTLLSTAMGIFALIRSSAFWLSLFAGAWLAIDPIVKCTFVVVYQHLRSRREGDDLRGILAGLPREQKKKAQMMAPVTSGSSVVAGAIVVLIAILGNIVPGQAVRAAQAPPSATSAGASTDSAHQAQIQKLRSALGDESQRAIYRWHDAEHPTPPTWLDRLLEKIQREFSRIWNAIGNLFRKLWPRSPDLSLNNGSGKWQMKDIRFWLIVIVIVTIVAGGVLIWFRRRRQAESLSIPMAIAPLPDLSDAVLASARSEDEWFALADRLQKEGELRLALRAAYLGLLAGLAQREWLTIRRDRTNREYLEEFMRRWRRRPQAALEARTEIPERLRGSLRQFDGVWYGSREVTPESVAVYQRDQRELLAHV
ncbi:MAG: DUF4129 domain-containing protein [Proteobacteria bacterium]|nr:DUF4129 domain-containing protein [Pseudomonadota bacterium]